jgi:hypothetical protein
MSLRNIAATLLASAALMLTGCAGAPPDGSGSSAQLVFNGLNAAILSVAGTAADDVYAVGADVDDGLGPYVLHYNGAQWRRLANKLEGHLWWISVEPIDGAFYLAGTLGKVVRFTSATESFELLETPGEQTFFGVWGTASDSIWAVGGDENDEDRGGVILHFDGTAFTEVDVSAIVPDGLPIMYKVWGRAADDVYMVGRLGVILHFDGADWSVVPSDTTRTLFTVHGDATRTMATGGFADAVIVEESGDEFTDTAPPGTPQMNGVHVPAVGAAVVVGNDASVAFRTADGWDVREGLFSTTRDFHACWVDPDGGVWAVGGDLSVSLSDGIVAHIGEAQISTAVTP